VIESSVLQPETIASDATTSAADFILLIIVVSVMCFLIL
jgi:hypothetical protein